jgi:membrane-associated phospholipid phosphatase
MPRPERLRRPKPSVALACLLALGVSLSVDQAGARAQTSQPEAPAHRLEWRWRRVGAFDYLGLVVVGGAYLYVELGTRTPLEPNWTGGILFDDAVREVALADTAAGRHRAGVVSDWFTLIPQAVVWVDTLGIPLLTDTWNVDTAWQMTVMNLQASALTGLLSRSGHHFIGRERPDVVPCIEDPDYQEELCFAGSNAGFPSGHTSGAFLGAGLVCAHHLNQPLYGGGAPDVAMCSTMLTMASTSAWLRLTADRHYVSDVIAGVIVGLGVGYGLPELLFYGIEQTPPEATAARWTVVPMADADVGGLALYGWF